MVGVAMTRIYTDPWIGILPSVFNINEPVIFGVPMVLNSYMFIPFVFDQGINGVIAFMATKY